VAARGEAPTETPRQPATGVLPRITRQTPPAALLARNRRALACPMRLQSSIARRILPPCLCAGSASAPPLKPSRLGPTNRDKKQPGRPPGPSTTQQKTRRGPDPETNAVTRVPHPSAPRERSAPSTDRVEQGRKQPPLRAACGVTKKRPFASLGHPRRQPPPRPRRVRIAPDQTKLRPGGAVWNPK